MNILNNSFSGRWVLNARRRVDKLRALIAQLFGNGEQGAMYIPKPKVHGQQVLWQDVEGTVPVMSDGDPVGMMLDLSGNGHHAIQEVSSDRPVYRTDGALHWLEGNGVNRYIYVPASESIRWATVNASNAPEFSSYWGVRTRGLGTANCLSGFSLSSSGPNPRNVGTFVRDGGEITKRIISAS